MTVASKMLRRAAELVREGWTTRLFAAHQDGKVEYCAVGALEAAAREAAKHGLSGGVIYQQLEVAFTELNLRATGPRGSRNIYDFNDRVASGAEEVAALMEITASDIEKAHGLDG